MTAQRFEDAGAGMKLTRRKVERLLAVVFVVVFAVGLWQYYSRISISKSRQIQVGMSKNEVFSILGVPDHEGESAVPEIVAPGENYGRYIPDGWTMGWSGRDGEIWVNFGLDGRATKTTTHTWDFGQQVWMTYHRFLQWIGIR
ncbi:MAG: hypothetical protein ACJ8C4_10585 [Gemmataceae bacterium]